MKSVQRLRAMERHTGQAESCPFCSVRGQRFEARGEDHSSAVIEVRCDTCGEPLLITLIYDEGSERSEVSSVIALQRLGRAEG